MKLYNLKENVDFTAVPDSKGTYAKYIDANVYRNYYQFYILRFSRNYIY